VIAVRLTVPFACWRKAHARELVESEVLPPPATCYGALLSFVGEWNRRRHIGARVTAGRLHVSEKATVLRTFWQIKKESVAQGNGPNAGPDFHQLMVQSDLVIFCDSRDEVRSGPTLEARVRAAFNDPKSVERSGGWSLGESSHLVNDAWLLDDAKPPRECETFVLRDRGRHTLGVWVDHVGFTDTHRVLGELVPLDAAPAVDELPRIGPRS
jgi:CRISPR-associated protein Cas5t